jgi:tRNA dimethylallyltransferase
MQRTDNEGVMALANELKLLDPDFCQEADLQNTQRVVRALEVCLATGKPYSSFRKKNKVERNFELIKIAIERPRDELYARIDTRIDTMIADGLMEEVKKLSNFRLHNALQTVGYKEVFGHLNNEYNYEEMVFLLKRNSRRYAKRQLTWFKNQDNFQWFSAEDFEKILNYVRVITS